MGALVLGSIALSTTATADTADAARAEIRELLKSSRPLGYVMPENPDLRTYPAQTVHELEALLKGQTSDCVRAVETALFMDAHIRETGLDEALTEMSKTGLLNEMVGIWLVSLPDEYAKSGFSLDVIEAKWISGAVDKLGIANNLFKTYDAVVEHNVRAVAASREVWVQEVVHRSILSSWDVDKIARGQDQLNDRVAKNMAAVPRIDQHAQDAVAEIKRISNIAIARLKGARETQLGTLNYKEGDKPLPQRGGSRYQYDVSQIELALTSGTQAVLDKRQADILHVLAEREQGISAALQAIAKARVQHDALSRYSLPMAHDQCEAIRKKGIVTAAVRCEKGDVLCRLTRMPHDRLLSTLKELGVEPSQDFLNCMCRSAGYGSSGTSQFYEADTMGKYDARYSCQQPGQPCIVAGMGCSRHPLPRQNKIWIECSAKTDENPVASFRAALRARGGTIKTK